MDNNFYMKNRHKLLLMVGELHNRGYGLLRVVPYMSPSGVYWRCDFVDKSTRTHLATAQWIFDLEEGRKCKELKLTPMEMAETFIKEHWEFLELCKGNDETYIKWYSQMLTKLDDDELPYAFADYFSPCGFWRTSKGKEIEILPGDDKYYFN